MKIDHIVLLNQYVAKGMPKDWLKGYIHCLYANDKITSEEEIALLKLMKYVK